MHKIVRNSSSCQHFSFFSPQHISLAASRAAAPVLGYSNHTGAVELLDFPTNIIFVTREDQGPKQMYG